MDVKGSEVFKAKDSNQFINYGSGLHLIKVLNPDYKKVVLTNDQELINNGVQNLDDDFINWFINNPKCQFVHLGFQSNIDGKGRSTRKYSIL